MVIYHVRYSGYGTSLYTMALLHSTWLYVTLRLVAILNLHCSSDYIVVLILVVKGREKKAMPLTNGRFAMLCTVMMSCKV